MSCDPLPKVKPKPRAADEPGPIWGGWWFWEPPPGAIKLENEKESNTQEKDVSTPER